MTYTPAFRSAVALLGGIAILGPATMIQYNAATAMGLRFLVLPAVVGFTVAVGAVVAIMKSSTLHNIFSDRWVAMSTLFAINVVVLAVNFVTSI